MPRMIQKRNRERGAVAVIVGLVVGMLVLTGVAALTIDAGSLYSQRRALQNGADAASLALAQICAANLSDARCAQDPSDYLTGLVHDNATPVSYISEICGGGGEDALNRFDTCDPGTALTDCPVLPAWAADNNWVQVKTRSFVRGYFAGLGEDDYEGRTVQACARAYWGPTSSGPATIPVTISVCEYEAYTSGGLVAPPPYPTYPEPEGFPYEHAIYQHDERDAAPCDHGPSGADFPGGFGYLVNDVCEVGVTALGEMDSRPGNPNFSALNCNFYPYLSTRTGRPIFLPIYDGFNQADRIYSMDGIAAFWLTGFSTSGNRQDSEASGRRLCTPSQTCLYGWFTSGIQEYGEVFGDPSVPPRGAMGVGVAG